MKLLSFTIFFACFVVVAGFSQSQKQKSDNQEMMYGETPSSLHPGQQRNESKSRSSKSSKKKVVQKTGRDLEKEYYDRVLAVAKAREKAARMMEKPQYSDPSYFGHKRKPKKRPPHKMKYCRECGIRH